MGRTKELSDFQEHEDQYEQENVDRATAKFNSLIECVNSLADSELKEKILRCWNHRTEKRRIEEAIKKLPKLKRCWTENQRSNRISCRQKIVEFTNGLIIEARGFQVLHTKELEERNRQKALHQVVEEHSAQLKQGGIDPEKLSKIFIAIGKLKSDEFSYDYADTFFAGVKELKNELKSDEFNYGDKVTPEQAAQTIDKILKRNELPKPTSFVLGQRLDQRDPKDYDSLDFKVQYHREPNQLESALIDFIGDPYGEGDLVHQTQDLRDRHTYVVGKSGSGKTTLLLNMIYQDLKAGHGLAVIAPEQEMLTEQILPYIPQARLDDVIYFNPADSQPVPFNPLHLAQDEDLERKVDEVFTTFKRIVGQDSGQRMEHILRQALAALVELPDTTLLDIPELLDRENPHFRQQVISQLENSYCAKFWQREYPQLPKDAHLPIINRLGRFLSDRKIRNTLCQTGPRSLNFRKVMDTGKIVLFNLSDGILGEQNSQLLGQLIVSQFQLAVASRANMPQAERRRFYLYIDEFQTFTSTATTSYEKILSRARKYRLALILAHQQTGQIPSDLLRDIIGNVSTMVSFTVSHADATRLSKEFLTGRRYSPDALEPTPPQEFIKLTVGQAFGKLGRQAFKMRTFPIKEKPDWQRAKEVIDRSRKRYALTRGQPSTPDKAELKPSTDDVFSGDPGDVF